MSADTDAEPMHITPWCWYYLADCGSWHRFEDDPCNPLKSDVIEKQYSEDLKGVLDLNGSCYSSRMDFSAMLQTDLKTNKQRRIRRVDYDIETSCSCWAKLDPTCPNQAVADLVKHEGLLDRNTVSIETKRNLDLCGKSCREKQQTILGVTEIQGSSVKSHPSWVWYYLGDCGRWHQFEDDPCSSLKSEDIEKHYLKNPKGVLSLTSSNCHTRIDFSAMFQTDLKTNKRRRILRDIKIERSCSCFSAAPVHWAKVDPTRPYQLIPLKKHKPEYQNVAHYVKTEGLLDRCIISIRRIQNLDLWEMFCRKKKQLRRIQGVTEIEEKNLFHGTDFKNVATICKYNFDVRLAGKNGHTYGKVYFARYASLADKYNSSSNNHWSLSCRETKVLFLARVITGKQTLGQQEFKKPDHGSSENVHNSCVDNMKTPKIFIIFDSNQIYPEYLIEYE